MNKEINAATGFLCNLLKRCSRGELVDVENFDRCLQRILNERYQDHWFPALPFRGSGYRCIRINHSVEPLLKRAADESGLGINYLNNLPNELTIWVDPKEVSYRIGEDGSIGVLYSGEDEQDKKNGNETPAPVEKTNRNQIQMSSSSTTSRSCNQQYYTSSDHHHHNINIRQFAAFVAS